ncbi:hypothetical protein D9757_014863 [Collybiopsis confluens]|nr:hypothetical protein D9757_014863 [Collybiopsis confluens]
MNCLPTEILIEIFLIHCETAQDYTTTISSGVWYLTQVSREWRDISLSLPALWSNVQIGVVEEPAKNQLRLLQTALEQSGSHPLSVQVHYSWAASSEDYSSVGGIEGYEYEPSGLSRNTNKPKANNLPPWPSERQLTKASIQALVQHSNRWKTAEIHIMYSHLLLPIYGHLDI